MVVAISALIRAIERFPRTTVACKRRGEVEEGQGHDGQALPRKAFCSCPAEAGRVYDMGV